MTDEIKIGRRRIGPGSPAFVIAEAGVNHNGDLQLAKEMIREAKRCGADCIKFQTFRSESIVTSFAPKANYQLNTTDPAESQLEMLRKLELPHGSYRELIKVCNEEGIHFLSTPYDIEDVDFLDSLEVEAFKVASSQAVEPFFLEYLAKKGKPVFLSTGMCTLAEVDEAVRTIRETGNSQIVVLQCTTDYPADISDCNLRAMVTMRNSFETLIGYSDHTQSLTASTVAVGLGASVIERHFTLDRNLSGPDQSLSSEPDEFKRLVIQIREVEKCVGSCDKSPTEKEKMNIPGMRRSIVAKKTMVKGTILTIENITFKRPATGLKPSMLNMVIGKRIATDVQMDELIRIEYIY